VAATAAANTADRASIWLVSANKLTPSRAPADAVLATRNARVGCREGWHRPHTGRTSLKMRPERQQLPTGCGRHRLAAD
jgi:hypothetical protein